MLALSHPDGTQSPLLDLKPGESLLLGSSPTADIRLAADGVQAKHARISNDNGLYTVIPFTPKVPVFVNGEYVQADGHPLVDGDQIQLGDWVMGFVDTTASDSGAAKSADFFAK